MIPGGQGKKELKERNFSKWIKLGRKGWNNALLIHPMLILVIDHLLCTRGCYRY